MKNRVLTAVAMSGALLLVGCSAENDSAARAQTSASPSSHATPAPSPSAGPTVEDEPTAASIAERLSAEVPTIIGITEVTEANDSNNLLGRPGQYSSATWIADEGAAPGQTGIDGGAVVEVFATAEDAQVRSEYIQGVLKEMGPAFGTEYHFRVEAALLRVSGQLPPSAASLYENAFMN